MVESFVYEKVGGRMDLKQVHEKYEKIMRSDQTKREKTIQLSDLMTEMEMYYQIPLLKREAWEKEHRKEIALYRKISMSREDL